MEGIGDQVLAARLASNIVLFTHLEATMTIVMKRLLGGAPPSVARIVLEGIKSPRGRIDVLRDLLARRPDRDKIPKIYEDFVRRFSSINDRRNRYVHGLWWQIEGHPELGSYLSEIGGDLQGARIVEIKELLDFHDEMNVLWFQIRTAEKLENIGMTLPEPPGPHAEPSPSSNTSRHKPLKRLEPPPQS